MRLLWVRADSGEKLKLFINSELQFHSKRRHFILNWYDSISSECGLRLPLGLFHMYMVPFGLVSVAVGECETVFGFQFGVNSLLNLIAQNASIT